MKQIALLSIITVAMTQGSAFNTEQSSEIKKQFLMEQKGDKFPLFINEYYSDDPAIQKELDACRIIRNDLVSSKAPANIMVGSAVTGDGLYHTTCLKNLREKYGNKIKLKSTRVSEYYSTSTSYSIMK